MAFPIEDPIWATNNTYIDGVTPNKIQPDVSLQNYGYLPDSEPTAQELNWQLNNLALQIEELKTLTAGAYETPINELKLIYGDNRNPNVIYGYGTWQAFAKGRTLVGFGTGTDSNGAEKSFPDGGTGGEYEVKLTESQLPQHQHSHKDRYIFENSSALANVPASNKLSVGFINGGVGNGDRDNDNNTFAFVNDVTGSVGGNQPHSNQAPYTVVYMWLRTA